MSSSTKQHKRAQRAKAKARQQRIQRNGAPLPEGNDLDVQDDYAFPGDFSGELIAHFEELQLAEAVSLEEMLTDFLQGPMAALALELDDKDQANPEQLTERLVYLLSLYWEWSEGLDLQATIERANSPEFDAAMINAMARTGAEMEATIEIVQAHYLALQAAEAISQEEMLKVFLEGPLLPDDDTLDDALDDESAEQELADEMSLMLGRYWEWSEGLDEDTINARLASPQFEEDLNRALVRVQAEHEQANPSIH